MAGEGRVGIAGAMVPSRGAALPIPAAPALSLAGEDRDKGGNEVRGEGPCPREVGGVEGSAGHGPGPEGPSTQGSAARSAARRVGCRKPPLGDGRGLHVLGGTRRSRWAESRPGPVGVWPHGAFALWARAGSPGAGPGFPWPLAALEAAHPPPTPAPTPEDLLPASATAGTTWPPRAKAALRPGGSTPLEPGRQRPPPGRQSQGKRGPSPEPSEPVGSCGAFTPGPLACGLHSRTRRPDGRAEPTLGEASPALHTAQSPGPENQRTRGRRAEAS